MGIVYWIIVGAIGGWLAGYALKRDLSFDLGDVLLGMVGAVVGGFVINLVTGVDPTGFSILNIFAAFIGAIIVAFIWAKIRS
jgi:uncharacterized membrane protein YeaQ/YmgE (transglycosylase-associated protein family)